MFHLILYIPIHARIQEFLSGGVQVSLTKKSIFFFSPQLFYSRKMFNFKEIYHFSRFQRGSNIFQGGSNFFQEGGGSNCLFPIETHITCDFPGGSEPPVPPLDAHLQSQSFSYVGMGLPGLTPYSLQSKD